MATGGRPFGFVAAMVLLGAAAASAGDPCTDALDGLRDEVRARIVLLGFPDSPAEGVELRALRRIERRLRRGSRRPAKDAATLRAAGNSLVDLYPSDAGIGALLDAGLDELHAVVALDREDLLLAAPRLPGGERRDRALSGAAAVEAALAADDAAPGTDHLARADLLADAAREVDATWRAVLDRRDARAPYPYGLRFTVREGGDLLWRANSATILHHAPSATLQVRAARRRLPSDDSELFFEVREFHGVGNYPIVVDSSYWRDGGFTYYRIVESGTLSVTKWDPDDGIVEGTFTLKARGCLFGCRTSDVTGG
ncbi:MAG TPA: hypothetical protein VFS92_10545, partial [Planctomycetota bacterium]|nr:hypothetical protein [Planctomycetota bacterium]